MERQAVPESGRRQRDPRAPYDNAGWTLPLQMGVTAAVVGGAL